MTAAPARSPWRSALRAPERSSQDTHYRTMLAALARPVAPSSAWRAREQHQIRSNGLGFGFYLLVPFAVAVLSLALAWESNAMRDWMAYWLTAGPLLLFSLIYFLLTWLGYRRRDARQPATAAVPDSTLPALREAFLRGASPRAPTDPRDSVSPIRLRPGADVLHLRVLPPDHVLRRADITVLQASIGIVALNAAISLIPLFLGFSPLAWQVALLWPWVLAAMLGRIIALQRSRWAHSVEVDDEALRWRAGRQTLTLPWAEVCGWSTCDLPKLRRSWREPTAPSRQRAPVGSARAMVYTLLGEHTSFSWLVDTKPSTETDAGQILALQVRARIPLPLQDLTPGVKEVLAAYFEGRVRQHPARSGDNDVTQLATWRPISAACLAVSCLLLVAGILLPSAQQRVYGDQLRELRANTAQLDDPLTSDRLGWTSTTSEGGPSFSFSSDGYDLVGGGGGSMSLAGGEVDDALVEVTVHQTTEFEYSSVGLVVRADPRSHVALVFTVDPGGRWRFMRYDLGDDLRWVRAHELRSEGVFGGVPGVHAGADAINRLSVIMRESTYTFFANNQFVGSYHDETLPDSGQVGIFVDYGSVAVSFTDLRIAPVSQG